MNQADELANELEIEYNLARVDYIRKKRIRGEIVDNNKIRLALNQRKKLKELTMKCLQARMEMFKETYNI